MNFKTLLFFFSLLFSITSNSQDFISQSLQYDGNNRQYELYIPQSYDGSENVPLLFNFHAGNGTSDSQIYISDMRNLADENNFIWYTSVIAAQMYSLIGCLKVNLIMMIFILSRL